jgi:FMN-dependent NADH-azoreductase
MPRVLHVQASPSARSHSAAAAAAFLDAFKQRMPDAQIDTIDVWSIDLPAFDATMIEAKFAVLRAQDASEEQRRRWQEAVAIARRFNSADLYVFSLPMWNYGVPYRLKHFIDVVTLPGENWTWSRERGYEALVSDKRAVLVCSSAGQYAPGLSTPEERARDFQRPYMRRWLEFIGVEVIKEIVVAPTLVYAQRLVEVKAGADAEARRFAHAFAAEHADA